MAKAISHPIKSNILFSPHSAVSNTAGNVNGMFNMSDMLNNKRDTSYAEITGFDRTTKNNALQQIRFEVEAQLSRLKNLNNKEFLAEMDVIKRNLNLNDTQMVSLILMTLREVPIRYRNCICGCYVHIKQKYNNTIFMQESDTVATNTPSTDDSMINASPSASPLTPPTLEIHTQISKYPPVNSFQKLFNAHEKQTADISSILETQEMEYQTRRSLDSKSILLDYIETLSTNSTNSPIYNNEMNRFNAHNKQMYIDTNANINTIDTYSTIIYKIRDLFLFIIPFLHTIISSFVSFIVFLEVLSAYDYYDDKCLVCNHIHNLFYGAKIHNILMNGTRIEYISFYIILIVRMSTILCWYILLLHSLVFHVKSCCLCSFEVKCKCCCCIDKDDSNYHLMTCSKDKHQGLKQYTTHQSTTVLLNSSISIEEHMRSQSRLVTSLNLIKLYLRMVIVPSSVAIMLRILLFGEHDEFFLNTNMNTTVSLCIDICVLFGFYWSLSDWFYFDKENVLVSWCDVYIVFCVDLATNWIKYCCEVINFILFVIFCALIVMPLTIFILLRIVFCPYLFGFDNAGCFMCNLFETLIEYILKITMRFYI